MSIIARHDLNPREDYGNLEDLYDNIVKNGQLEAIKLGRFEANYYILDGFRRYKSRQNDSGLEIKYEVVREYAAEPSDLILKMDIYALIQSTHLHKPLDYIEKGNICLSLQKDGMTYPEICEVLGIKSSGMITRYIKFASLPKEIKEAIREGKISQTRVESILNANNSNLDLAISDILNLLENPQNEVQEVNLEEMQLTPFVEKETYLKSFSNPRYTSLISLIVNAYEERLEPAELEENLSIYFK